MTSQRLSGVGAVVVLLALVLWLVPMWGGDVGGASPSLVTQPGAVTKQVSGSEIERRLALAPFAYVAETDFDTTALPSGTIDYSGAAAFVDSGTDTLAARPVFGESAQDVAVAPDGAHVYMTDAYLPVLHVLDAETMELVDEILLPGVDPRDPADFAMEAFGEGGVPYSTMRSCAGGVACTPDGAWILVNSSAGLQVIDAETDAVVRTIPEIMGGAIAVAYNGTRAYVACDDFDELAPRDFFEWFELLMETEDCRLVCLDLATWEVTGEIPTALVGSIAIKPDGSEVFFSEIYKKRVRVVDALTLEDAWTVSTTPSYSIGIGFVPNGTKAYVVCSADTGYADIVSGGQTVPTLPKAEDFFCAVVDTSAKEIIKRIPLEAY